MDTQCSVCNGPYTIRTKDEFGKEHVERIECLGHYGLLPYVWNLHPEFSRFQKASINQARVRAGLPPLD